MHAEPHTLEQIDKLGMQSDRMGLCALGLAHARLGKAQRACYRFDLAAVSFDRYTGGGVLCDGLNRKSKAACINEDV